MGSPLGFTPMQQSIDMKQYSVAKQDENNADDLYYKHHNSSIGKL